MLILDLKPYPKTRTTEPSDGFLHLRRTSLDRRWKVKHFRFIFCFSGCWFNGLELRISELFKYPKILKERPGKHFFRAKSKTENFGLFALYPGYLFYVLFGCPMTNFWLVLKKQCHSADVNHFVFRLSIFDPKVTRRGWVPTLNWVLSGS